MAIVASLQEAGADKDARAYRQEDGATPLHVACEHARLLVVAALLQAGADKEKAASDGSRLLHAACSFGHLPVVVALLAAGADRDKLTDGGLTALHLASSLCGHEQIVAAQLYRRGRIRAPRPRTAARRMDCALFEQRKDVVRLLRRVCGSVPQYGVWRARVRPVGWPDGEEVQEVSKVPGRRRQRPLLLGDVLARGLEAGRAQARVRDAWQRRLRRTPPSPGWIV